VFRTKGEEAYRKYQEERLDDQLASGVAFPFIRRLLSLNDLGDESDPLVEVIILSRNDPDAGRRVMRSCADYCLPITRAIFTQGESPYKYMSALNMSLFLSANDTDVREAVKAGLPAGRVLRSSFVDDDNDPGLRIAFDFDGVLADDTAEQVYRIEGVDGFRRFESTNLMTPHDPGPLRDFLANINKIQRREEERRLAVPGYRIRVRVSIITARDAPAHERAVASLKSWGVAANDAFFMGGIEKRAIVEVLRPHIFFDDQEVHVQGTAASTPSVHVPFGVINNA